MAGDSPNPTVEQARAFCEVAKAHSYIAAAERLNLAGHVPLIRLVSRFTKVVGRGPLVRADSRGRVTMTAAGLEILPAARRLVEAADALASTRPQVRFSAYPSIAARVATRCSELLVADVPLILTDVSEGSRDDGGRGLVRSVAEGTLDLAIAPTGLGSDELEERFLYAWDLRIVVPADPGHPLCGRRTVRPEEIASFRIAASPPGHKSREALIGAFALERVALRVELESTSQDVLRSVAEAGRTFVAVIPDDAFDDQPGWPRLVAGRRTIGGRYALYLRQRHPVGGEAALPGRDVEIDRVATAIKNALAPATVRRPS